ncbi:MAG TPA: hypothetical protein VEZ71_05020, partial [Archangium sp.]|nr:hypothetical protein [Archangium sp.]
EAVEGAKTDTSGLALAIQNLTDMTFEQATAAAQQAASAYQAANAMDKMTQSLTNAPSTWKYALRSFEAQNARSGGLVLPTSQPASTGTGAAPSSPAAPAAPAPAAPLADTINIIVQNEYAAMTELERRLDDRAFRARGSRGRGQAALEVP